MRAFISRSLFMVAAGMMCGCAGMGAKSGPPSTTQAADAMDAKVWFMQSSGTNVLKVTAPADFKCATADGMLHFTAPAQYEVELWVMPGSQSVDDALGHVNTQIVSELKDFKPDHTTDLTVAGSPAKRLVGVGHEADDGDPGDADVIVFKVVDHVFVACTHGETLNPIAQQAMLTLVQTAQKP